MAKLSAHGTELLRVEFLTHRLAYMSDGKILRDCGGGWKQYRKFKPGINIPEAVERVRLFHEGDIPPERFHRSTFRKRWVQEFPALLDRARAYAAFELLGDDIDGIWSELDDAGFELSLDDVKELRDLRRWACDEGKEERERQQAAAAAQAAAAQPELLVTG